VNEEEVVIKVDQVYKDFLLPHEKSTSIKGLFTGLFRSRHHDKTTQNALKDISFEIKKGEFFGIVGRNGGGKSTMLKILAGIYQPTKGSVFTKGKLVPFIELGVGFNPELTGRENVYLNGAMLGFSEKEVSSMYHGIVDFAELGPFMDQKLKNYSSGMQVRLAFSMATRAKADILLVDEVLAVGDADFQRKCFNYFRELKKNKKTVVFVSHDMTAVREYCDRAILIEESSVVAVGATSKVTSEYTKLFLVGQSSFEDEAGKEENRWGDRSAQVADITVRITPDTISVIEVVIAHSSVEHPIAGFRIRDAAGSEVLGTNSQVEERQLPSLVKGEKMKLRWNFPNVLSDGQYSVDPAILLEDGITVADWWDDAKQFIIKKSRHLPYTIDPGYEVQVEKMS
jgi:ABC-2 type transport system ATP-binding protein